MKKQALSIALWSSLAQNVCAMRKKLYSFSLFLVGILILKGAYYRMSAQAATALIVVLFFAITLPFTFRSIVWTRFLSHTKKGNYDKALRILESKLYSTLFGKFDQNWNILRIYLSCQDAKKIEFQTRKLLTMNLNKRQMYQVCSNVYFYFLDAKNTQICKELLEQLKFCAKEEEYQYNKMLYRIMIEKQYDDIDTILKLIDKQKQNEESQQELGLLQYLLALQYSYKKDKSNCEKYAKLAKTNLKGTPYYSKAKHLVQQTY